MHDNNWLVLPSHNAMKAVALSVLTDLTTLLACLQMWLIGKFQLDSAIIISYDIVAIAIDYAYYYVILSVIGKRYFRFKN